MKTIFGKTIGLQFHLESSLESIYRLVQNCSDELVEGKYIQSKKELLSADHIPEANQTMSLLLDNIERQYGTKEV